MRWPHAHGPRVAGRAHYRANAERVQAWHRARSHLKLVSTARGEVVVSFHLAGVSILGRRARHSGVALEAVLSQRRAQTAAEHAVRLGAQERRPAGADPTRCRTEARAAQHGRDRGGGDADPELQQLTLDAHVAPARVLPRQPLDQAARLGRKRGRPGLALRRLPSSSARCQRRSARGSPQSTTTARTEAGDSPQRATLGRRSCTAAASLLA
jgi:hypothetical protein